MIVSVSSSLVNNAIVIIVLFILLSIPLAAGLFNRSVYLKGKEIIRIIIFYSMYALFVIDLLFTCSALSRRAVNLNPLLNQKSSRFCSVM